MLRYDRQTKPGLVALYDIGPGNGAGPFLQTRSPHGAYNTELHRDSNYAIPTKVYPHPYPSLQTIHPIRILTLFTQMSIHI